MRVQEGPYHYPLPWVRELVAYLESGVADDLAKRCGTTRAKALARLSQYTPIKITMIQGGSL